MTWMTIKETIRRLKSWSRNRSFIGLTSWQEEEEEEEEVYIGHSLTIVSF